ncbi:hypothetical protein HA052_04500 [Chromobacterium haemolyticum]|uniref:SGNH hydrolase-type esterase domain-containing protein n=1 Tax=Chromobacterium fluminis TaxID=3044269 RepID=A0ABX0L532_9NEIS|nr:hypothetical protein [Chromobacterium haemolyticum]NHR04451.1 hypothetical protein [Chromobacterium haemolyticum]
MSRALWRLSALVGGLLALPTQAADCLVLGDSLAVGISRGLPGCVAQAKVGRTTRQNIAVAPGQPFQVIVISTGSNDKDRVSLEELRSLRLRLQARTVVWVIPSAQFRAAAYVQFVAREFGDLTQPVDSVLGPDNVHPTRTGYRRLSAGLAQYFHLPWQAY